MSDDLSIVLYQGKTMKDLQLVVWQNDHKLTLDIYPITQKFPDEERYGLTSQIRHCSASKISARKKARPAEALGFLNA